MGLPLIFCRRMLFPVLLLLALPLRLSGQSPPDSAAAPDSLVGWNSAPALDLIARAQQRRTEVHEDTALLSYRADARAYVYFYLDREDTGQRNLVKTDQVALDVIWRAPNFTKQRIVGWRDARSLPTNIRYHIDHLAVVMENFGDEIRIGDGDEVADVLHPAAPGAERFYEYRVADSLSLRLPGSPEPVRVYQVEVRPRDLSQPAFLGSVFVDRRGGDIVRMDFTFTPSAYRDRYLDYINISLDNGLWKGRFWLPNEQQVELRREIPQLDIPAGSVIRGSIRIGNYRFNDSIPLETFSGPPVVALPRAQRDTFTFEEGLYDELREQGLGPETELSEIRRQALKLARHQALGGLAGKQLFSVGAASDAIRYNRAEGAALSAGVTLRPTSATSVQLRGGWAFGAEHPLAVATWKGRSTGMGWQLAAYANRPRDVGVGPVASGVVNTLSSLFAAEDYRDLFFASGAGVEMTRALTPSWTASLGLRGERHRSAEREAEFSLLGDGFRPVHKVDNADLFLGATLGVRRAVPFGIARWWALDAKLAAGALEPFTHTAVDCTARPPVCRQASHRFIAPRLAAEWGQRWQPANATVQVEAAGGLAAGSLPRQELYLIGGRGTLPGYPFRAFGGDRFATVSGLAAADLGTPWLRGRLLGALGGTAVGDAGREALLLWGATPTDGLKASVGFGVGLVHDILHVDVARGFGERGTWELILEANRSFWDFL